MKDFSRVWFIGAKIRNRAKLRHLLVSSGFLWVLEKNISCCIKILIF